jgi:Uncharacterized protein encoded in hypervariable junctions of pilus gene clusters
MNTSEFAKKLSELPEVAPNRQDKAMIKRIAASKDEPAISLDQLKSDIAYSGKISLRVPKSLHRDLVSSAKEEGISLNQFLLYKLSR